MATNAQQVGIVSSTKGQVFARNAEGEMRRVQAGDPIFEGDVIIAAAGASAEISLLNGSPSLFVSDQQIVAIDEQVATTAPDATAGAVSELGSTEAAKVVQKVAGGTDFEALLEEEAPAAGLTAGDTTDGGHTFVDLVRVVEAVPGASYEFPLNPTGTPPVIEGELAPTLNEVLPPSVDVTVRDQDNMTEEDTAIAVSITANAGDATDELTALTVTLPDGWTATLDGNTYSGTFVLPASGQTYSVVLMVTPPPDSDVDGQITAVASARDISDPLVTADSLPASGTVVVDTVLDDALKVEDGGVSQSESATVQYYSLGLTAEAHNPHGQVDGAPADATESGTATLTVSAPAGFTIGTGTGAGFVALSGNTYSGTPAQIEAWLESLTVKVDAGADTSALTDGQFSGSVSVTYTDVPTADGNPNTTNDSYTDTANFSVTVAGGSVNPSAAVQVGSESNVVLEDGTIAVTVTAAAGNATDELTGVTITLPDGWTATIGSTNYTGTFSLSASGQNFSQVLQVTPGGEDTDVDGVITAVASARDISDPLVTADSLPASGTVVVDTVLDDALKVEDGG
ncbi:MAG: retention module-containing protein, partial [Dechloromonas sp.]|nr:retention module-containing protein [Dechloromonas sp.]